MTENKLSATSLDYIQLKRFGLIQEVKDVPGYYNITQLGIDFCLNRINIPKYHLVRNNISILISSELINIKQCLGKKFKYEDIFNLNNINNI